MTARCRDDCLRSGEPLAGTAGAPAAWFGISWPKPRWHPEDKARSDGLPPALARLEAAQRDAGRKIALRLFQREARPSTDRVEVFAFRPRERALETAHLALEDLAPRLERWLAGEGVFEPCSERLLLVCTDGRHDRCCAEHGRPLLESLRAVTRGHDAWTVLESSHIGGHRFAANCLALPEGHLYGRLAPADAAPLFAAVSQGEVWKPGYRGRLGLSEPEQAAEAWLCGRFPDAASIETRPAEGEDETRRVPAVVHWRGDKREVVVSLATRPFGALESCGAAEPVARTRWIATGLEPH
ncbi:MAG: hypothetical protein JRG76_11075 [Deltaproteobacteria bacterium]|nr:hypothetical protein [Deltaproteobacteria bacterium]